MDSVPLVALEREWKSLVQGRLADELRRWRLREPALSRFESPQRVLAFLWDWKASASEKDCVLLALLRLARTEELAGRVVLQAMMPALKALARGFLKRHPDSETEPALEREELWQVLFTAMLQQIKTYPLTARPRKVAANLRWDTHHAVTAEFDRARTALEKELPEAEPLEPFAEEEWVPPPEDVVLPLQRAVAARAINAAEARLILETEVEGVPLRLAAKRLGISYNAAKHRRRRAERRLLMFLRPWTQTLYVQDDPKRPLDRPSSDAYASEENIAAKEDVADQTG